MTTRSCLGSDILEAMECLARWAKAGVLIDRMEATARSTRAIVKVRRIRTMILVSQTDIPSKCSGKMFKNSLVQSEGPKRD
jgi:hypothetical protein